MSVPSLVFYPMRVYRFFVALLFLPFFIPAHAQESRKFKKNRPIRVSPAKSGTITGKKTPVSPAPPAEAPVPPAASNSPDFEPAFSPTRPLSLLSEDTTTLDEGETSIVEVEEQVQVDSVWINIANYYSVWDSRNVNPYHLDPRQFKDTIPIRLYDERHSWSAPLNQGTVNSSFGFRGYRWHYGTDLDLSVGDSVKASFDGIVRIAKWDGGGYGNYLLLRHYNGLETLYGHLTQSLVAVGELVRAGQLIGWGGNTGRSSGPHLHYEIRYQGNAINPSVLYNFAQNTLYSDRFLLTSNHFEYLRITPKHPRVRKVIYHKVRSGDTLGAIARRYGVSATSLRRLNRMGGRSLVRAGQRLRIR